MYFAYLEILGFPAGSIAVTGGCVDDTCVVLKMSCQDHRFEVAGYSVGLDGSSRTDSDLMKIQKDGLVRRPLTPKVR